MHKRYLALELSPLVVQFSSEDFPADGTRSSLEGFPRSPLAFASYGLRYDIAQTCCGGCVLPSLGLNSPKVCGLANPISRNQEKIDYTITVTERLQAETFLARLPAG